MPDPKLAHLGQRSCASAREGRTYERKRSDHPSQCRHLASRGRPHMAPRRGRGEDRRQEALALAGGRPGWGRARRSGPEPAGQAGRQALASQAAEAADAAPACHGHGQAGERQRREGGGDALGGASEAQGPCMGTSMSRFEFSGSVPPVCWAERRLRANPRGARHRARGHRATTLYSVDPLGPGP